MTYRNERLRIFWRIREKIVLGEKDLGVAIGQTSNGRYVRVIYVPDPEIDSVFVVTAHELQGKPLLAYRRRRRRKWK